MRFETLLLSLTCVMACAPEVSEDAIAPFDYSMVSQGRLSATVTDADGNAVQGALVLVSAETDDGEREILARAATLADGSVSLRLSLTTEQESTLAVRVLHPTEGIATASDTGVAAWLEDTEQSLTLTLGGT